MYAKDVTAYYKVDDLTVMLSGTADVGSWNGPFNTKGPLTITVDPIKNANHFCDYHARLAFQMMNSLLNSGLFVDFPQYWEYCRDNWDPQKPYPTLSGIQTPLKAPLADHIDIKGVLALADAIDTVASPLLDKNSDVHKLLNQVKEYVNTWPDGHVNHAKGQLLAKQLEGLQTRVHNISGGQEQEKAQRALLERELDVLGAVVPFGGGSGRNCKVPMISATVTP